MVEPAFGIGGALTALQQGPNVGPEANDSGDLRSAAADLSRAAQGLEQTRGNISGQTMAINQMANQQDQRMREIGASLGMLQNSISSLANSINRMASSVGMMGAAAAMQGAGTPSAVMGGMPTPLGPPPSAEELNQRRFGPLGAMAQGAMGAVGMVHRGAQFVGGGIGRMGGAMVSPFVGAGFNPAAPGQYAGSLANAGGMRSFMQGTGIPFRNDMLRTAGAGEVTQLAAQRAAQRFGDIGIATGFGAAELAAGMGGGMAGAWAGGALGGTVAGPVGGLVGAGVGGMVGDTMAGRMAMMATRPMMRQVGEIRGGGELAGRQAFRFMDPSQLRGAAALPNFRSRQRMGTSMMQEGLSDLVFDNQDMQEMFGGMVEQDLMRGANNVQEVRRIFRMNKEAIKNIGRTMATTVDESAEIMGELQALGVDVRGRGAVDVLAGAGVRGLTRREALSGQMAFSQGFAGTGLQGRGLMGMGALSQQMGQSAIASGALSPELLAAVGGRSGAQQVMGQGVTQLLQGPMGMAMMAAGMQGGQMNLQGVGGMGMMGVLQKGGAAATAGNIAALTANPQKFMRQALEDPNGVTVQMMRQVTSTAEQLVRGNPGVAMDDAVMHVLQGMGMNSQQADAFLQTYKQMPDSIRQQGRERARSMNELVTSQAMENLSVTGRARRFLGRITAPGAVAVAEGAADVQEQVANLSEDVRNRLLGLGRVSVKASDINLSSVTGAIKKSQGQIPDERRSVHNAKPSDRQKTMARASVKMALGRKGGPSGYGKLQKLNEATSPQARKEIAKDILNDLSEGRYDDMSPQDKKAFEEAISEQAGTNMSQHMSGVSDALSPEAIREADEAMDEFRMGMTEGITGQALGLLGGVAAGGVAGQVAGGAIGVLGALTPFQPVTSLVSGLGGIMGAIGLGSYGKKLGAMAGLGAEESADLARDPNFQNLVRLERKKQEGTLTKDEQVAYAEAVNKVGIEKVQLIQGKSKEELRNMEGQLEKIGKGAVSYALRMSTESAAGRLAAGLEGIGEEGDAGRLLASARSPQDFAKAIGDLRLDATERAKLSTDRAGQAVVRAADIASAGSVAELRAMGLDEELLKEVTAKYGEGPLDPKAAAEIAATDAMRSNAVEGNLVVGGRGTTEQQRRQQTDMLANISQNTVTLINLNKTLQQLQQLPALRKP